ncbi:hypothetical protein FA09DRAFT_209866 [Tilletiopsis washingtonensis]|uniref:Uncharacterized protein n=1 Tax=Tilletiopsis washingtonensis TaxID=58919 RepID=A0A316ZFA8_9BASI|nr:hypothetical protein FA09DRAFT_209866 [Tilletiopsis washingtonensis]PWO00210.1 hypothetical protein FA09DRAFT_209866 [Tilletiopsis washingtonensis]
MLSTERALRTPPSEPWALGRWTRPERANQPQQQLRARSVRRASAQRLLAGAAASEASRGNARPRPFSRCGSRSGTPRSIACTREAREHHASCIAHAATAQRPGADGEISWAACPCADLLTAHATLHGAAASRWHVRTRAMHAAVKVQRHARARNGKR